MISINRNLIFSILGILSIFIFWLSSLNLYLPVISLLIFLYFIFIPGTLTLLIFQSHKKGFWNFILLSLGLSIFLLMFMGLMLNWFYASFLSVPPLQKEILLIYFGFIILILLAIGYLQNKYLIWKININIKMLLNSLHFIIPVLFPVLSIMSATLLNNSDNNIFSVISLSLISLTVLISSLYHKKLNANFYPFSIYFISLSLLLLISMRSWYVSGWDIQNEFKLFQLTKELMLWSPANWNDAYNACLSITLLPTIITKLTAFPDDYVYKLLYQIIFAFTPVIIFQTFKQYVRPVLAYLAVVYIIAQPLFIQPMTALMRQEIAFLFFALIIYVLFENKSGYLKRTILFVLFSLGMILSHYSTTYVAVFILTLAYLVTLFFKIFEKNHYISKFFEFLKIRAKNVKYSYYINIYMVGSLIAMTFIWYGIVNNYLSQVQQISINALSQLDQIFKSDIRSGESQKAVALFDNDKTTTKDIDSYEQYQLKEVGKNTYELYSEEEYKKHKVIPMEYKNVPPQVPSFINGWVNKSLEILKQLMKIILILSPLFLLFKHFKKNTIPREIILICLISVLIISLMTFHPTLGLQYNLSRIYLQLLFFLALPTYLLLDFLLKPLRNNSINLISVLTLLIFVYLVGLTAQFFGGESKIYFNNYGTEYDNFYVHTQELKSSYWLKNNLVKNSNIFSDREANLRLLRHTNLYTDNNILPSLIYKNAYVYSSYANYRSNITSISHIGTILVFSFPHNFLINNKAVIYNNGGSVIYK